MSVRRLSPTANLLRNSKLFALPNPLPKPSSNFTGIFRNDSDTATVQYPTHAAIETPADSLGRGDWGLKRALPLRSTTRTSTPNIKIDNVDSIDYITDFGSAADHTQTLAKWQDLDMPVSVMDRERRSSGYVPPPQSVFETEIDNTAIQGDSAQHRWKFQGPWLAGQDERQFDEFLARKVRRRRREFQEYLRRRLVQARAASRRREILENGEETHELEPEQTKITDDELNLYMKRLRKDEEAMEKILIDFLDLPREEGVERAKGRSTYNDKGPPSTHPSAGLSYLRTASHMYNHPVHGPQDSKSPVLARVLKPQGQIGQAKRQAVLGVGGVVAVDPKIPFAVGDDVPEVERFDPDQPGAGKIFIQPKTAAIDTEGQIKLVLKRAEKNAVNVLKSDRGTLEDVALPAAAVATATNRDVPDLAPSRPRPDGAQGYGIEGLADGRRNERAKPFEGEGDLIAELSRSLQRGKRNVQ